MLALVSRPRYPEEVVDDEGLTTSKVSTEAVPPEEVVEGAGDDANPATNLAAEKDGPRTEIWSP